MLKLLFARPTTDSDLLVRSLAAAELSKSVSHDTAMKMLDIFADAAEDRFTRLHWKVENPVTSMGTRWLSSITSSYSDADHEFILFL